ncbi:hypothetical protein [Gorillibacterium massiliense]|uniref:hypothetical protein n=1 Tax=Gorillibacterium massiliense TaxID=1280390 RepID=UPI0004B0E277|nr:hypothetical protein [Gorillibacterium massiliense]
MPRIVVLFSLLILFTACRATNDSTVNGTTAPSGTASFSEQQAVSIVLKDHPEYPEAGQTKAIETVTGGLAPGTKVTGSLATEVEAALDPQTYIVTLTKEWNFSVNGEKLIGKWVYNVTPEGAQMLSSEDNTDLIQIVK